MQEEGGRCVPVLRVPQQHMRSNPLIKDSRCSGPDGGLAKWQWTWTYAHRHTCARLCYPSRMQVAGVSRMLSCWTFLDNNIHAQCDVRLSHFGMLSLKQFLSNKEMSFWKIDMLPPIPWNSLTKCSTHLIPLSPSFLCFFLPFIP